MVLSDNLKPGRCGEDTQKLNRDKMLPRPPLHKQQGHSCLKIVVHMLEICKVKQYSLAFNKGGMTVLGKRE